MRNAWVAVVAIAVLATAAEPAYAQKKLDPTDPLQMKYDREERDRKAIEKQYDETMKHLKSQGGSSTPDDPWRKVRPATSETNAKR